MTWKTRYGASTVVDLLQLLMLMLLSQGAFQLQRTKQPAGGARIDHNEQERLVVASRVASPLPSDGAGRKLDAAPKREVR